MNSAKMAYKPVGLALGAVSGMVAGAAFKQTWKSWATMRTRRTPPTRSAPGKRS